MKHACTNLQSSMTTSGGKYKYTNHLLSLKWKGYKRINFIRIWQSYSFTFNIINIPHLKTTGERWNKIFFNYRRKARICIEILLNRKFSSHHNIYINSSTLDKIGYDNDRHITKIDTIIGFAVTFQVTHAWYSYGSKLSPNAILDNYIYGS